MARAARYIPVRAAKVSLWDRTVGAIVPYSAGYYAFEYDPDFLSSGLDIAPPEAEEVLDPWCGWHDFHAIKVNGKQSKITDDDLLTVADRFAIGTAPRVLREVKSALE